MSDNELRSDARIERLEKCIERLEEEEFDRFDRVVYRIKRLAEYDLLPEEEVEKSFPEFARENLFTQEALEWLDSVKRDRK
jgi:hypothetical protein